MYTIMYTSIVLKSITYLLEYNKYNMYNMIMSVLYKDILRYIKWNNVYI